MKCEGECEVRRVKPEALRVECVQWEVRSMECGVSCVES